MSLQPFAWFWWHFAQWRTLDTYSGSIVTISKFWKSKKMVAAAIFTVTKIAIPLQQFDRSIWNLVRWCKMGLLNAPTVKKISKVKHGGQPPFWKPLNCRISILMKFGTVMYIGPLQHTRLLKLRIYEIQECHGRYLENHRNLDISTTVLPIFTRFDIMIQNGVFNLPRPLKNLNFKNSRMRRPLFWKPFNRYVAATVWPILMTYGMVTFIGLFQRTDR